MGYQRFMQYLLIALYTYMYEGKLKCSEPHQEAGVAEQ